MHLSILRLYKSTQCNGSLFVRWNLHKSRPFHCVCAGSLIVQSTLWTFGLLKQTATLHISSRDTCQCLNPPFQPFTSPWIHPCYNQPQANRLKFRLETNGSVVWLFVGSVNSILPDMQFGMVGHIFKRFIRIFIVISVGRTFQVT